MADLYKISWRVIAEERLLSGNVVKKTKPKFSADFYSVNEYLLAIIGLYFYCIVWRRRMSKRIMWRKLNSFWIMIRVLCFFLFCLWTNSWDIKKHTFEILSGSLCIHVRRHGSPEMLLECIVRIFHHFFGNICHQMRVDSGMNWLSIFIEACTNSFWC